MDLNKILIIITIQENHSEFSKYIGEMTITIPCIGIPEIAINNHSDYTQVMGQVFKNHEKDFNCEGK